MIFLRHTVSRDYSALSDKANSKSILVIEDFKFDVPKTKHYYDLLVNLGVSKEKTMLIVKDTDTSVLLSARNLKQATVTAFNETNVYNVLNASKLIITEGALKSIKS